MVHGVFVGNRALWIGFKQFWDTTTVMVTPAP